MEICREHDYHPSIHATRLFSKTAKTIGFLYGGGIDIYNENRSISLFYVTEALSEHGYRLLPFCNNTEFREKEEYINVFKRGEIDGLIVWGASGKTHSYLKALNDTPFPVLYLTNKMPERPSVYSGTAHDARSHDTSLYRTGGSKACRNHAGRRVLLS
jgi:DNA-binding LacI/PurR family transcriptional regulator